MPPSRLLVLLLVPFVSSHIRLTFPPSRSFSDALTNDDLGVCSPKAASPPDAPSTFLLAGSTIDIEWTSGVPHSGGVRIEIVDSGQKPVAVFSDLGDTHNISRTVKSATLPKTLACQECLLVLTHAANEISPDRTYVSCANVNIGKSIPDGDTCSGRGKRVGGTCVCRESFVGSHCQHRHECEKDEDCGKNGSCHSSSPFSQVCYCPPGRRGMRCEQVYSHELETFDESQFRMKQAGKNKIFWRILNDEIEVVLKYPGRSWAAIGWKSANGKDKCPSLPIKTTLKTPSRIAEQKRKEEDADLLPSPVTTTRSTPTEGGCGENEEMSQCAEESRECEASCDWTRNPDSIPTCSRECATAPRCVCKEGFVRASANSSLCVPFVACDPAQEHAQCGSNETWAQCGTACEPSCANMYDTSPCPASCEKAACTCADNYVRHERKCIYWGDCPDLDEHFAFSDDNGLNDTKKTIEAVSSSPVAIHVPPTSCPVNETISDCGNACETDCVSIFIREQCSKCGPPDCTCIQGYARSNGRCVYWGDCPKEEIDMDQVPKLPAPRVTGSSCKGEWAYPFGCTNMCQYRIMWNYMEKTDEVEFALEAKLEGNGWTGVAFGDRPDMVDADYYIVKSFNGSVTVEDMWSSGRKMPEMDQSQDIAVPRPPGTHADGMLRTRFKRRRVSRDKKTDVDFTDDQCLYMMFPVDGGHVTKDGKIMELASDIHISDRRVCFKPCQATKHLKPETRSCDTEFRHPPNCSPPNCEYIARWQYNSTAKDVRFEISARDLGRWTGIGFSKNGEMSNADIYTGWMYEGKAHVTDRFAYGRQLPAIDPSDRQDIFDIGGKVEDDVQTIWFRRPLVPKDALTDLPLDKCYFYLFPVGGGRVLARKSSDLGNPRTPIGYHDLDAPRVSATKICICDNGVPVPEQPPAVRRRRQAVPFNVPRNPFGDAEDITTGESGSSPMACVDMVVGSASEKGGRVVDMYSMGTSTPLEDTLLGGKDSLTAASATYDNGITTITFRKKLKASDATDNSIVKGPMQLLWAQGVDPSSYRHITGGAPIKADPTFFSADSFKYHGMDNRGMMTVDFFGEGDHDEAAGDASDCHGRWSFPHGCNGTQCHYIVSWSSNGANASFTLEADVKALQWTAVGFSETGRMADSDVIVVSVLEDGKVTVIDQWMPSYGRPTIDRDQDIFDVSTKYSGGRVYANFSRDLGGIDGHDVSLDTCRYFLYTPHPSPLDNGGELKKHTHAPTASSGKICLKSCSTMPATEKPATTISTEKETTKEEVKETSSTVVTTTTEKTTQSSSPSTSTTTTKASLPKGTTKLAMPPLIGSSAARYALKIRILNREFVPDLLNEKSDYYQSFTKDLKAAVDKALSLKWKDVKMGRVLSYTKGSVVALVEVESMTKSPKPVEIKSVIEENAIRGPIHGMAFEPTTVNVEQLSTAAKPKEREVEEMMMDARLLKSAAIVGLAVLVALAAICCCCCIFCRIRRVSHRFSPMGSTSGKAYSDIPYKSDTYPAYPNAAGYPYGTLNMTKTSSAGFDNKAYQHQRHFSQATTASTKQSPAPSNDNSPAGIGETTYHEWLNKVASKPASQQHEEALTAGVRPPSAQPYVSYPNDPSAYYTLGGEHRSGGSRNYRPPQ